MWKNLSTREKILALVRVREQMGTVSILAHMLHLEMIVKAMGVIHQF